ncbi:MAG: hypothetical protein KDB03_03325 [Planctomycetales bacterium]|nr:hypothetical protein [Planctomycetales bacterium]
MRDALILLDRIITDRVADFWTWRLAGEALLKAGEFAQALDAFEHAEAEKVIVGSPLIDDTDLQGIYFQRAQCMYSLGQTTEAVELFRELADSCLIPEALCNLATIVPGCPNSTNQDVLKIRQRFAASLAAGVSSQRQVVERPSCQSPLRIGYISSFFHCENYMKPIRSMLNAHDRVEFEIELFADDKKSEPCDWLLASPKDQVFYTSQLSNCELVDLIIQRELDILVDLNGYSVPERLPVYAQRLAKVGLSWFNMYATSGLPAFDWIVGDEYVVKTDESEFYTEKVALLPISYLSFDVTYTAPPVVKPPCIGGQPFTFGSLVSQYKLTPHVFDAWCEILRRSPMARLLLSNKALGSGCNREYVQREFQSRGIESERLEFLSPGHHTMFLGHYGLFDIALDAFPYNGGTTTTEAIWQGVPVITFVGDRWASRTSSSLLNSAGLEEFVAPDLSGYVELAISWANSPDSPKRLAELRSVMREKLLSSDVCDSRRLARSMENIFREVMATS